MVVAQWLEHWSTNQKVTGLNKARFCAFSSTLPFKSTSSTASQLNMGKLRPSGILAGLKHLLIHVTIILFTICWKGNFFPSERINCDNFEAFEEKKIIYRFGFERKLRHLLIFLWIESLLQTLQVWSRGFSFLFTLSSSNTFLLYCSKKLILWSSAWEGNRGIGRERERGREWERRKRRRRNKQQTNYRNWKYLTEMGQRVRKEKGDKSKT